MILYNCTILTGQIGEIIKNAAVCIKDDKIVDVGNENEILEKYMEDEEQINLDGKIIMPGLSNPYTSFYINEFGMIHKMAYSDLPTYEKFSKIVGYSETMVEDEDLFEDIVRLGGYKSLINGITTSIVSIPYSKNISRIDQICESIGVKIKPSPIFLTENGIPRAYRRELINNKNISSITILGVWGLEDEDYEFIQEFFDAGKRIRIVLVDYEQEERYSQLKHGEKLLEVLKKHNVLSKKVDIIFAGKIDKDFLDYISYKGVRIIKAVRTEQMEIEGSPELLDLLGRGVKVAIGTGIIDYSLFNEAKTLLISEKAHGKSNYNILYNEVERTIFMNNYQFASDELATQMGKIAGGYDADITILNSRTGDFIFNTETPFTEISFAIGSEVEVWGAIVSGKISLWDRKLQSSDMSLIRRIQKDINKRTQIIEL
ncbi:MAG: hypothetical protein H7A31_04460 [Thermotogae bacterium]|nr:hypothetical protein [Thermotogota bacterium]MCP5465932.1 hypothetical protein [Thermotogota bacterium]